MTWRCLVRHRKLVCLDKLRDGSTTKLLTDENMAKFIAINRTIQELLLPASMPFCDAMCSFADDDLENYVASQSRFSFGCQHDD